MYFDNPLKILKIFIFLFLFLITFKTGLHAQPSTWLISLNQDNSSYSLNDNQSISETNNNVAGIYIDNDTTQPIDISINAKLDVSFDNVSSDGEAYGIYSEGYDIENARPIGQLLISSNGSVNVTSNGNQPLSYGILAYTLDNLSNLGTISVKATGDLDAYVSGVEFDSAVKIENNGQILVDANSTGSNADAYGIYAYDTLDNFSNTGTIKVIDNATNGYAYAEGIHALYIENFNNNGNIEITTIGFDTEIYGIYTGEITNFTNNGTLSVTANTNGGDADAYGIYAYDTLDNFTNNGTISITANTSDGDTYAYGIYSDNGISNFINNGTISINVSSSNTNPSIEAYALYLNSDSSIINNGTMKVIMQLDNDSATDNINAAVFYIDGSSDVTISNYGSAWV